MFPLIRRITMQALDAGTGPRRTKCILKVVSTHIHIYEEIELDDTK